MTDWLPIEKYFFITHKLSFMNLLQVNCDWLRNVFSCHGSDRKLSKAMILWYTFIMASTPNAVRNHWEIIFESWPFGSHHECHIEKAQDGNLGTFNIIPLLLENYSEKKKKKPYLHIFLGLSLLYFNTLSLREENNNVSNEGRWLELGDNLLIWLF